MDAIVVLLLSLLWVLTLLSGLLGWKAGARPKPAATVIAACVCLLLLCGTWFSYHTAYLPEWLITPLAVYLHGSWFAPPAALLFLLGAHQAVLREPPAKRNPRRQVGLFGLLSLVVLFAASNQLLGPPSVRECDADLETADALGYGGADADNVVRQSTVYTCAAASCATLLRMLKIDPEATEHEMVPLCMTRRWGGASALGMAVGLKHKAADKGWHVRIVEPDWDEFCRLRKPLVCAIRYSLIVNHAVVACAVDAQRGVLVADPLNGLSWWSRQQFEARFQNEAIVVYRTDPFERE